MAQRIKLGERDPHVRVELGSKEDGTLTEFKMKPVTMSVEEELDDLQRETQEAELNPDSKPIDLVELEVRQLDIVLEPAHEADAGKTPTEFIVPAYRDEKITRAQIRSMIGRIVASARPT